MFTAAFAKNREIVALERSNAILGKVLLSGGGRCNLCNAEGDIKKLISRYPRNGNKLRKIFFRFPPKYIMEFFEREGLHLKVEAQNRVFPASGDSREVAAFLAKKAEANNCKILTECNVLGISDAMGGRFKISFSNAPSIEADEILVATGGRWENKQLRESLIKYGHTFSPDVPSLFALDLAVPQKSALAGLSQKDVRIKAASIESCGDIVFTHTGISGPAVLELSSLGALEFQKAEYKFDIELRFLGERDFDAFAADARKNFATRQIKNAHPQQIPQALWNALLEMANVPVSTQWSNLKKADEIKLKATLSKCKMRVVSRRAEKSEFVTAGGIDVDGIDFSSMQSRLRENLYLGGECINIDAVTGGYNLMACWAEGLCICAALNTKQ